MRVVHRKIVGAFIFSGDGKVLLGKNRPGGAYEGSWTIPGGGVESGEQNIEALRREVGEEVGVDIGEADVRLLGTARGESTKTLKGATEPVLVSMEFHDYQVSLGLDSSEVVLKSGDDFCEARWFGADELEELEIALPAKKVLARLIS